MSPHSFSDFAILKPDYDFEEKREPPPKTTREKEEEELQRVLALSLQDQGGRTHYTPANMASRASPSHQNQKSGASAGSGRTVVPAVSESTSVEAGTSKNSAAADPAPTSTRVARVRALYDFTAGEQGELGFQTGDVIRVLNTAYEHWWKGELHGRMGIFPVNYVVRASSDFFFFLTEQDVSEVTVRVY